MLHFQEYDRQTNQLIKTMLSSYDAHHLSFSCAEPEEWAFCFIAKRKLPSLTYPLKRSGAPQLIKGDRGQQHDQLTAS